MGRIYRLNEGRSVGKNHLGFEMYLFHQFSMTSPRLLRGVQQRWRGLLRLDQQCRLRQLLLAPQSTQTVFNQELIVWLFSLVALQLPNLAERLLLPSAYPSDDLAG